ncbi:MAG: response regulator [Chloroflexi bacterium]|nr:response regulator [Chloroflexota bacterium]
MADRILIVDDDPGVVALCERLLTHAGYEVASSMRPQDALRMMRAQHFDLLLLDIRMPEMSGFELMQVARERDPELAIVIITGHGTIETVVQALQIGAEGFVLKPFESGVTLVQSVREALIKSRQAREAARSRALRPLFEVSQYLLAETDPQRLRSMIVASIQGHFGATCAGLYNVGADQTLHLVSSQGFPENFPQTALIGADSGLPGRAVAWSLPLWVTMDMPGDPALLRDLEAAQITSALCAPLIRRGQPTGAIIAGKGKAANVASFREGDLELLTIFAGQAAVAMENSGLYAELREYVKRIEDSHQQLIQVEKLAALGRLVGSIAHEVNNPLQAIQNCLHLAEHKDLAEAKRKMYHDLAAEEVTRLIKLVRDMLDLYRPTAADFALTDLNTLLDEVLTLAEKPLRDKNVAIKKQYRKDLPSVPVVRNNLKQVFLNLILNAGDAMPNGGRLTLKTSLSRDNKHHVAQVSFIDNGVGIAHESRAKLFEPFYTTKAQGTGLGLAVSYSIVEAHGGHIQVESVVGSGSTFTVQLPLERNVDES